MEIEGAAAQEGRHADGAAMYQVLVQGWVPAELAADRLRTSGKGVATPGRGPRPGSTVCCRPERASGERQRRRTQQAGSRRGAGRWGARRLIMGPRGELPWTAWLGGYGMGGRMGRMMGRWTAAQWAAAGGDGGGHRRAAAAGSKRGCGRGQRSTLCDGCFGRVISMRRWPRLRRTSAAGGGLGAFATWQRL